MGLVLCTAGGLLCLLYYLGIGLYAGFAPGFSLLWAALGAVLLLAGQGIRTGLTARVPVLLWGVLAAAAVLVIVILTFLCSRVIRGMRCQPEPGLPYVVVLGAQVRGETPSKSLRQRLDRTLAYARENPGTVLILSGGQGSGERISEAECMRRYLTAQGIPEERLVLEDSSTSTMENLKFSDELTGCGKEKVGIVSNSFHIYRALRVAEKLGYTEVQGIPAASDAFLLPNYVLREAVCLAYYQIRDMI